MSVLIWLIPVALAMGALGLVGFLATVAFARFIQARGKTEEERFEALPFRDPQSRHVEPLEEGKTK